MVENKKEKLICDTKLSDRRSDNLYKKFATSLQSWTSINQSF